MINSVMLKNIQSLRSSINENISYTDLNFRGIVNDSVTVSDAACLRDQFRIWLMSDENDFHRQPEKGGFLAKNVVKKPFIDSNCPIIEALLVSEAEQKFPNIKIVDVSVKCNHSTNQWNIQVSILDKKTGLVDNTMFLNGEAICINAI